MARIYYRRIVAGLMGIDDVPALWRAKVRELADAERAREPQEDGQE